MRKIYIGFGLVFLLIGASLAQGEDFDKLTISGYFRNETTTHLQELETLMKIQNTFQLEAEYRFNDNLHLFGIVRKFYDHVFDVESSYEAVGSELCTNKGNSWLRELYLDILTERLDIRLGKQQVVWGTADGVRILDQVNPADSRNAYSDDPVDYRIPLWMLKTEYAPTTNGVLQFLLIPDFEPNCSAPAGSPFAYRVAEISAAGMAYLRTLGTIELEEEVPEDGLNSSKVGLRWLDILDNGLEYTINYLHGYDHSPAYYYLGATGTPSDMVFHYCKKYERTEMLGGSFTKGINTGSLQGLTIRGEFAYIHDEPVPYGTDGASEGITHIDRYNYVLGFDRYFWTNVLFSYQFIQFINSQDEVDGYCLLNEATLGMADQIETMMTLKVAKSFLHERIKPEIVIIYGLNNDWKISPKVQFEMRDNLLLTAGIHFFEGRDEHLYGEFADHDQIYLQVEYGF